MDEFDLEVTDLRTGATRRERLDVPDDRAGSQSEPAAEATPQVATPPARRIDLRVRRQLAGLTAAATVILAFIVIMAGLPPIHAAFGAFFPPPTPTPTLGPGDNMVYVIDSVPWGSFSLDGRSTPLPLPGNGNLPMIMTRGAHTLVYRADPFPTLRCRLNVPPAPNDTCPLVTDSNVLNAMGTDLGFGGRVIDLEATPNRLPSDQQAALVQQVTAALATPATTTVAAGDHYVSTARQSRHGLAVITCSARLLPPAHAAEFFAVASGTVRLPPAARLRHSLRCFAWLGRSEYPPG